MTHKATARFWRLYEELPPEIQRAADQAFALLKENPKHPSLHFKKLGGTQYWSARISRSHRVLAVMESDVCAWFWIGSHGEYDRIIKRS